jgi:hypothetical protein
MTFPIGAWSLSAANDTGTLTISSTALGTGVPFGGTVAFAQGGISPISGFFDETTRAFNFLRIDSSTSPPSYQSYTGTLYPVSVETTTSFDFVTVTVTYVAAGFVQHFPQSTTGTFNASAYTWLATLVDSTKRPIEHPKRGV